MLLDFKGQSLNQILNPMQKANNVHDKVDIELSISTVLLFY